MNKSQMPALAGRFDAIMRRWMAAHFVRRGSLAVMCDNRLVVAAGYGGRDINERVPIWSLSKAISALCMASFIREGRAGSTIRSVDIWNLRLPSSVSLPMRD